MPPCVLSSKYCGRPSSRGSQPIPAFWLSAKMSPLGALSSISSVKGSVPCGPAALVCTSMSAGGSPPSSRSRSVSSVLSISFIVIFYDSVLILVQRDGVPLLKNLSYSDGKTRKHFAAIECITEGQDAN